jgi:PEP-CTERM motif
MIKKMIFLPILVLSMLIFADRRGGLQQGRLKLNSTAVREPGSLGLLGLGLVGMASVVRRKMKVA